MTRKKIKQDNALNFLLPLDQKLEERPETALAEKQVTVKTSTKLDCVSRFALRKSIAPKDETNDWIKINKSSITKRNKLFHKWIENPSAAKIQA